MTTDIESLSCLPAHVGAQARGNDVALLRALSSQGAVLYTRRALRPEQQVRLELKGTGVRQSPEWSDAWVEDCQRLSAAQGGWSHQLRVSFASQRMLGRSSWPLEGHLQTLAVLLPTALGRLPLHEVEDVHVPIPGGALLARTHWLPGSRPLFLLVHGVAGNSESSYVRRAAATLLEAGYHVARLNLRGAGDGRWLSSTIHHTCMTEDLDAAVRHFSARDRVQQVLAVGFSLGGNMALAAAAAPPPGLCGVASISAPLDLHQTVSHLERSQPLYHHHVLKSMQDFLRLHGEAWPTATPPEMVARALRSRRISELDEQVMAPHHGFKGVADYYARTSCGPRLRHARIPCLVIHAEDDPMIPISTLRPSMEAAAASVSFLWLPRGGHVGFHEGLGQARWHRSSALEAVLAWAQELLSPSWACLSIPEAGAGPSVALMRSLTGQAPIQERTR
jgi:predicted alpha/beta-fold hydrolase